MIVEISVLCIAVSFAVLVAFLVAVLLSARATLKQVNGTLSHIERKMDDLSGETIKLMRATQQIADDVHDKMKSFDALFRSIGQVGESVQQLTSSVKQVSVAVSDSVKRAGDSVRRERHQAAEWMDWAALGVHLWQKWQARRRQNQPQPKLTDEREENDG